MVPNSATPAAVTQHQFWRWNSPLPYLFGSLSVMVALITVALIVLACSMHKHPDNNTITDVEEKASKAEINPSVMVPQVLVIMAGGEKPTHLAVPMASLPNCPDDLV